MLHIKMQILFSAAPVLVLWFMMKLSWLHLRLSFAYAEGGEDSTSTEK